MRICPKGADVPSQHNTVVITGNLSYVFCYLWLAEYKHAYLTLDG
jgi:hypothetical protein